MNSFSVTVRTAAGLPLPGAGLRLLAPDGTDLTTSQFGASPVYTDATGTFIRVYLGNVGGLIGVVPLGNYQIVASTPGYQTASVPAPNFKGYGDFVITLVASVGSSSTTVTGLDDHLVTPMTPAECTVAGVAPGVAWELIEATVTDETSNESSVMEVPVVGGQARLNLQARFDLEPLPHLVPDGDVIMIDADFSRGYNVTLESLTPSGRQALDESLQLVAANAYPLGEVNTLSDFSNVGDVLSEWLTPWAEGELPKFSGHYADAMCWLTGPGDLYKLVIDFQNVNRVSLTTRTVVIPSQITAQKRVMRVRIPEPEPGSTYAVLTLYLATIAQSKPLLVRYLNG